LSETAEEEPRRAIPAWPALLLAGSIALALGLRTILWGLPSLERNRLLYGPDAKPAKPPSMTDEELSRVWEDYPNFLPGSRKTETARPRSDFNAIRTVHPDEHVIIKGLARMNPRRLDLFPGFFAWPALQFYIVGAALQISHLLGIVTLVRQPGYYFAVPVEMARMFVVGRLVTLLMGLGALAAVWAAMRKLFGRPEAMGSVLLLAVTPLFTMNSHYLTADVPMLGWIALCLWASANVLKGDSKWWYALAGAAVGCSAATRYQGALAALIVFAAHVLRDEPELRQTPGKALRRIFLAPEIWLAGLAAIGLFLMLNFDIVLRPTDFWRELSLELKSAGAGFDPAWVRAGRFLCYGLGIPLTLAAVIGVAYGLVRRTAEDWFLLFAFGPSLVFLWLGRPAMLRYMMPVLLLPVLLAGRWIGAWAAARLGAWRGFRRFLGWTAGLLVFGISLLHSMAYAQMFDEPNPWLKAGKWIDEKVPDGATVAILVDPSEAAAKKDAFPPFKADPWIAQLPPMNAERLQLIGLRMRVSDLDATAPDYVVIGDMQLPPVAVRGPLNNVEARFLDRLQNRFVYEAIKFRNFPTVFGLNFARVCGQAPHDMRYADPGIAIYRRTEEEAR